MSSFWGYPGADILAVVIIGGATVLCLVCAVIFVTHYGK